MKPKTHKLALVILAAWSGVALAQRPADDPVHALLPPPEVLIQHRAQIGLSDEQIEKIGAHLENLGPTAQPHETKRKDALARLTQLLAAEQIDEEAAQKQLDRVLAAERELRQLHVQTLIRIRNELTADQRRAVAEIRQALLPGKEVERRLQAKIAQIEKEVQKRAEAGQPPFEAVQLMQKFPELMKNGQVREAEALLDRVLDMLGLKRDKDATNPPPPAPPDDAQSRSPRRSPAELAAQVASLKQDQVVWREIAWKTCLVDGLNTAREQDKPVVLWIFIDRPQDDERC